MVVGERARRERARVDFLTFSETQSSLVVRMYEVHVGETRGRDAIGPVVKGAVG